MPPRTKSHTSSLKKGAGSQQSPDAKSTPTVNKPSATTEDDAPNAQATSTTSLPPPPQTAAEISNYIQAYLRLKQQEQQELDAQRPAFVAHVTKTAFPPVHGVRRGEKGGMVFDYNSTEASAAAAAAVAAMRTTKKRPRADAVGSGSTMEVLTDTSEEETEPVENMMGEQANRGTYAPSSAGATAAGRARSLAEAISEASVAGVSEELFGLLQHHPSFALAASRGLRGATAGRRAGDGCAAAGGVADEDAAAAVQLEQFRQLVTDAQRRAQQQQQQRTGHANAEGDASSRSPPPAPTDEDVAMAMFTEISRISQERRNLGSAMAAYKNLAGEVAVAAAATGGAGLGGGDAGSPTEREVQNAMAESVRHILGMADYGVRGGVDNTAFSAAVAAAGLGADSHLLSYDEDSDDFINLQLAIEDQKARSNALEGLQADTLQALVDATHSLSFPSNTAVYMETMPTGDDPNRATVAQRLSEHTAVAAAMLLQMLESRLTENTAEMSLLSQGKEETHKYLTRLHQCLHHELHTLPDDRLIEVARCVGLIAENDAKPDASTHNPDVVFEALSAVGAILFFAPLPLNVLEKVCAELGIGISDEASMDRVVLPEVLAEKIACHIHRVKLSLAQLSFVPRLQVHEHAPGSYTCTLDHASCLGQLPQERLISNRFSCSRIRLRAVLTTSRASSGALNLHVWHRHPTNLTTHMLIRTSEPKKKKKKGSTTNTNASAAAATQQQAGDDEDESRTSSALFIEQEGVAAPGDCFGFDDFVKLDMALDAPTTLQYGLRTYNKLDDRLVFQLSVSLANEDGSTLPASNKQQQQQQQQGNNQLQNQSFDSVPASTMTGTTNQAKGGGGGGRSVIDNDALLRQAHKQAIDDLELAESEARAAVAKTWRVEFVHLQNEECRGVRAAKQKTRERLFKAEMTKVSAPPELVRESEKLQQAVQNYRQQVQKLQKEKTKDEKEAVKTEAKLSEASEELARLTAKIQEDRMALAELEKEVKAIQTRTEAKQQRLREHNERKKARQQLMEKRKRAAQEQQEQQRQLLIQQQQQQQQHQRQQEAAAAAAAAAASMMSTPNKLPTSMTQNMLPQQSPMQTNAPMSSISSAPGHAGPSTGLQGFTEGGVHGVNSLFIPDFGTFFSPNNNYEVPATATASTGTSSMMLGSTSMSGAGASGAGSAPAFGRLFSTSPAMRVQQQQEQQQQQQRRAVAESTSNGYMMASAGAGLPPFSGGSAANLVGAGLGMPSGSGYTNSSPSSPGGAANVGYRTGSFSGTRSPQAATDDGMGGLSPAVGTPASLSNAPGPASASSAAGPAGTAGMFGAPTRFGTASLFTSTSSPFVFSTGASTGAAGPGSAPNTFNTAGSNSGGVGGGGGLAMSSANSGHTSPAATTHTGVSSSQPQPQPQATPLFSTKAATGGSGASSTVGGGGMNNEMGLGGGFNAAPGSTSPSPMPTSGSLFPTFQVAGAPAGDIGLGGGGGGGLGLSAFTTNPANRVGGGGLYGGGGGHLDSDSAAHAFHTGVEGIDLGGPGSAGSLFTVSAGHANTSGGSPLFGVPGLSFPGDALSAGQVGHGRPASGGSVGMNQLLFRTSPMQGPGVVGSGAVGAVGTSTPPPGQNAQSPMGGIFDSAVPYQW